MAGKAITREDLIFILQGVFKASAEADNGFRQLDDGFYVKDYGKSLKEHTDNMSIHIDEDTRKILEKITVNSEGIIMYDGQFAARISSDLHNGLEMKPDGLFVKDHTEIEQKLTDISQNIENIKNENTDHHTNGDIHVTPEDKANWDNARAAARDEANKQIAKLTLYDFKTVNVLPAFDDAKTTTVYMLYDPEYINGMIFTLWVKLPDKWQQLNMSMDVFKDLMHKSDLNAALKKFTDDNFHEHSNKTVLDKFEENDGNLIYDGRQFTGINPLEIRDLINSIKNATSLGVQKKVLFRGKMNDSGKYQLSADIENFAFLVIDYRTDYRREGDPDGSSKSVTVDPDTLAELYDEGLDYLLELGHGTSCAEARINARGDQFCVNYWNRITIYKITGYGEKEVEANGGESA